MGILSEHVVLIRGGGEVASAAAHRLHRSGFRVCLTEMAHPLAVCRGSTFSEAVFDEKKSIEGVTAELAEAAVEEIRRVFDRGNVALIIDPKASIKDTLKPDVLIHATMSKRSRAASKTDAPLVIGMGPGFFAGTDVHVVVETNHSNNLGRVIEKGKAEKNTGEPVTIGGLAGERVVWAPAEGLFTTHREIGQTVSRDDVVAHINDEPLKAPIGGILRGLLRNNTKAPKGAKLIEVDPVGKRDVCFTIRDKMRAIAGGVLEAVMMKLSIGKL